MSKQQSASHSIGLGSILTIIFVIAKITGYIDWSWWLVFAPLWAPLAIVLGFAVCLAAGAGIMLLLAAILEAFE